MSGVVDVRPLESTLFGVRVGSAAPATITELQAAVEHAKAQNLELLVLRIPAHSIANAQAAEAHGALLCDILLACSVTLRESPSEAQLPEGFHIRAGHEKDATALHGIASRAFRLSSTHWHADSRLDSELSNELYGRWASALCQRSSEQSRLIVVERNRVPCGFLAFGADDARRRWHVPLTAVAPDARGNGLLGAMLTHAIAQAARGPFDTFEYETQLSNDAAMRVISKMGFFPETSRLTYHLWLTSR